MALNSRFSCLHHYRLHLFAVLESPSEGLGQFEPSAFLSARQALYKLSCTPSLPCLCFGRMSSKGISQPLLPKSLAGWDSGHDGHQVLGPSCCLALPGRALLKDGKLQGFTPERGGMDSQGVVPEHHTRMPRDLLHPCQALATAHQGRFQFCPPSNSLRYPFLSIPAPRSPLIS